MDYHRLTSKAVFRYLTWLISYSMKQTKHLYILASTNAWNQTHFLLLSPLARFREILQDFVRIPILLCEHAAKAVFRSGGVFGDVVVESGEHLQRC